MDKHQAHDIVHEWNGGKAENCPSCNGRMDDSETMAEAKSIATKNFKPRTNPMIPYDNRLHSFAEIGGKERDALSDSDFAYIDSKGDRKLPIHDADHVKNALSRFGETQFDNDNDKTKAKEKIDAAAKKFGIQNAEEEESQPAFRSLVNIYSFAEKDEIPTVIKVIPIGKYKMNRYGEVNITREMIQEMVKNFKSGVRAGGTTTGLPIDIEHGTTSYKDAAAGWIKNLEVRKDGGYATVEWTPVGEKLLKDKVYKFYSPEYWIDYTDPENNDLKLKNVMTGGGLVNKPMIKHDLNPIVNGETATEKNLTNNKSSHIIYLELTNDSPEMKLSEIIKIEKSKRSSEEQKFVVEHKDELTFAEAKSEGLAEDAKVETKTEKKEEVKLEEGQVVVTKDKFDSLVKLAEAGSEAANKLKRAEIKEEVKTLVMSEKGSKLPTDQIDVAVDLLMGMSDDQANKYKEQLKALPEKQIFEEQGTGAESTTGTATAIDLDKQIKKYAEDNKVSYSEAASAVMKAEPTKLKEYNANLPVAQQER